MFAMFFMPCLEINLLIEILRRRGISNYQLNFLIKHTVKIYKTLQVLPL